jgi:hypothetical protein
MKKKHPGCFCSTALRYPERNDEPHQSSKAVAFYYRGLEGAFKIINTLIS